MLMRAALILSLALAPSLVKADRDASMFRLPQWPAQVATPALHLTDTKGRARTLEDFKGHVAIVYFGFVSCPDVCPATLHKLALAGRQLGPAADRIDLLFVTLDPEHDTAAQLDAYVKMAGLRATALSGTPDSINRAAKEFSVQHARIVANGARTIDHSGALYIIDGTGRLRLVAPLNASVEDLAHDLRLLAANPPS